MNLNNKSTVSVLITNYNHSKYLKDSIESVLKQSIFPNEFIIIDDCSTDNSVEIINKYVNNFKNIKFIKNITNQGPIKNTVEFAKSCKGDYIGILSADDYWLPNFLEDNIKLLEMYPQAALSSSIPTSIYENSDNLITNKNFYIPNSTEYGIYLSTKQLFELYRFKNFNINSNCCLFKKDLFNKYKLDEDLKWHCDFLQTYSMSFDSGICFVPKKLTVYRVLSNSYSSHLKVWKNQKIIVKKVLDKLNSNDYLDLKIFFVNSGLLAGMPGKYGIPGIIIIIFTNLKYLNFLSYSLIRHLILGVIIYLRSKFYEQFNLRKKI